MARSVKIAISLPASLLDQVDAVALELKQACSAVLRTAAQQFVEDYLDRQAQRKASKLYAEIAEEDARLCALFGSIAGETIPGLSSPCSA